jgi:hypothetical protein
LNEGMLTQNYEENFTTSDVYSVFFGSVWADHS